MSENLHFKQLKFLNNLEDIISESVSINDLVENTNLELLSEFKYKLEIGIFENETYPITKIPKIGINFKNFFNGIPTQIDDFNYILPLIGKLELKEKTGKPENEDCILGAIKINSFEKLKKEDTEFFKIYAKRMGIAIHNRISNDFYEENKNNSMQREEKEKQNLIDFAQTFNHEVRGNITIALGFSNLSNQILNNLDSSNLDKNSDLSKLIDYSGKIITSISNVESKLPFLKILNLNNHSVRENARINNYLTLIEPIVRKVFQENNSLENKLVFSIDKTLLENSLYVDPLYINLIFDNLIKNACNHGIENGTMISSIYKQNGDVVFDFINSINGNKYSKNDLSNLKKKGVSFSNVTNRNSGLGLFIIDRVIKEGYNGKLDLDSKDNIDITRALDEKAKIVIPIKGSIRDIFPQLGPYYRAEVRIPYENFDFRNLI